MKKYVTTVFTFIVLLGVCSCASKLPDNPIVFSEGVYNEKAATITDGESTYIFLGAADGTEKDECIGYLDLGEGKTREYIYTVKGQPDKLIAVLDAGCKEYSVYEKYDSEE